MVRGLYAASSGMANRSQALGVTSNNIANVKTAGYKADGAVSSSFGSYLIYRYDEDGKNLIGSATHGVITDETYTSFEQGPLEQTGNPNNLAIAGNGFFTLQRPDGSIALSRNGQFMVDQNGYLSDSEGNLVLGTQGPILAGGSDFKVNRAGEITIDGEYYGSLRITCPPDTAGLIKQGGSLYIQAQQGEGLPFEGSVMQGFLESSNTDTAKEMTDMIENSRAYQTCGQVVRMIDQILNKAVNELGRL